LTWQHASFRPGLSARLGSEDLARVLNLVRLEDLGPAGAQGRDTRSGCKFRTTPLSQVDNRRRNRADGPAAMGTHPLG